MQDKQWKWIGKGDLESPNGDLCLFIRGTLEDGIIDVLNKQEEKIKELENESDSNYEDWERTVALFSEYLTHKGLKEDYIKWRDENEPKRILD